MKHLFTVFILHFQGQVNDAASLSENSLQSSSTAGRGIPSTQSSETVSSLHSLQLDEQSAVQPVAQNQNLVANEENLSQEPELRHRDVDTNV